jgi:deoxyribodipyrimidine photo-lyase
MEMKRLSSQKILAACFFLFHEGELIHFRSRIRLFLEDAQTKGEMHGGSKRRLATRITVASIADIMDILRLTRFSFQISNVFFYFQLHPCGYHQLMLVFRFWTRSFAYRISFHIPQNPRFLSQQFRISKSTFSTSHFVAMPPKTAAVNGKRKASAPAEPSTNGAKKSKPNGSSDPLREPHPKAQEAEENGIVLRKYYPHEMSNARALAYNNDEITRPIELLNSALSETRAEREKIQVKDVVVHWFKCDLRTKDNKSLHLASEKAKEKGVPLIAMYIVSPQDFEAHLTAPVRVDFILRTLEVLKSDLAKLDIPLYVETVEKRKKVPERILELLGEWGASHIFANVEYEVDELRREASLVRACLERGIAMDVVPDTCVVSPGELTSGTGRQYSVYTPWFRAWVAYLHDHPDQLDLFDEPGKNPEGARKKYAKLFESKIPSAPENKKLTEEEKKRFRSMWPPGEHEAYERLEKFCDARIVNYSDHRNFPAKSATSSLSVHLASGTLSSRTCIRTARDRNNTKKLNSGNQGIQTWISEVAWRDFYKHVLAHWPYVW